MRHAAEDKQEDRGEQNAAVERNNAKRNDSARGVGASLSDVGIGLLCQPTAEEAWSARQISADAQIVLCGPGREGLPKSGFVRRE